jgi:hypothetical protein
VAQRLPARVDAGAAFAPDPALAAAVAGATKISVFVCDTRRTNAIRPPGRYERA